MTWCHSCGAQYEGSAHACGDARISKDRLRELLAAERKVAAQSAKISAD